MIEETTRPETAHPHEMRPPAMRPPAARPEEGPEEPPGGPLEVLPADPIDADPIDANPIDANTVDANTVDANTVDADTVGHAISELEQAITANVADERLLLGRLRALRSAQRSGQPWRSIVRHEAHPTTLSLVGRVGRRLASATRSFRHGLAVSMMREGATAAEVARHFDVSRQRVSHLVRQPARQQARRTPGAG
ncbi:MAG TPA: hypothetical protein VMD59_03645 [Acidimicrobiales bacterium]|nr:hypothetical protein [Acidimicrobiales bacterium]